MNTDNSNNQQNKGEKSFSIQPVSDNKIADPKFAPFQAQPGPAHVQNMPEEEGTKAEREVRKTELNK